MRKVTAVGHRSVLRVVVLTMVWVAAGSVAAAAAVEFDIEAQPMAAALQQFAEQADVQVYYPQELVEGVWSQGVSGALAPEEALRTILAGTGLGFETTDDRTYVIRREGPGGGDNGSPRPQGRPAGDPDAGEGEQALGEGQTRTGDTAAKAGLPRFTDEITVTGTNLRGAQAAQAVPLVVFDRDELDAVGLATTFDLVETLPMSFGEPQQDYSSGLNGTFGAGVDLRGLGADSTLVLVNGRRTAPSGGGYASYVDISTIPLAAVERVEVVTDGSSAIYGSDAVGGVVNFKLRDRFDGFEVRLRKGWYSDAGDGLASMVWGTAWDGGDLVVAYEFQHQSELQRRDRHYAASLDLTEYGGSDYRLPWNNPGNVAATGGTLPGLGVPVAAIPAGQDGTNLSLADFDQGAGQMVLGDTFGASTLIPTLNRHSLYLDLDQELGSGVHLFGSLLATRKRTESHYSLPFTTLMVPAAHPYNPFGEPVLVYYAFAELGPEWYRQRTGAVSASLGLDAELAAGWRWEVVGTYSEDNGRIDWYNQLDSGAINAALEDPDPATVLNPFGDGSANDPATLERIAGSLHWDNTATLTSLAAKADGGLGEVAGGEVLAGLGVEYREEVYDTFTRYAERTPAVERSDRYERTVQAAFAELRMPLFEVRDGAEGGREAVNSHRLELSAAARFEEYEDFGSTVDPKLGLAWTPVPSVLVRGSWGTSFRAPLLHELYRGASTQTWNMPDPARGEMAAVTIRGGGNPELQEETADTLTAGLVLTPAAVPGLRLELSYFDISFSDRIVQLSPTEILANEAYFPERIERAEPTAEDVAAGLPGRLLAVDARRLNSAVTETRGFDLHAAHVVETSAARLTARLDVTYTARYARQDAPRLPLTDVVGTFSNPPELAGRLVLGLARGPVAAHLQARYVDGYFNDESENPREVGSYTTFDLVGAYTLPWLDGVDLVAGARNLLDEDPPFVDTWWGGYDARVADPRGRILFVELRARF